MKPDVERFLMVSIGQLMTTTGAALGPGYEQSNVMLMGAMLTAVQAEFDRAAARRAEENAVLRDLFQPALGVIPAGSDLHARLSEAAATTDASLKVSDLERTNASLRGILIELHAAVEEIDSPAARALDDAIWRELAASTERRRLPIGPF